jgi:hypothetical protein
MACAYCGQKFGHRGGKTKDHVVPESRGGTDAARNLLKVCAKCNTDKRNWTLSEWHALLKRENDTRAGRVASIIADRAAAGIDDWALGDGMLASQYDVRPSAPIKIAMLAVEYFPDAGPAASVRKIEHIVELSRRGETVDYIAWATSASIVKVEEVLREFKI